MARSKRNAAWFTCGLGDTARDLPAQDGPECATDDRRLVDLREPLPVIKGLSGGLNSPLLPTLLQIQQRWRPHASTLFPHLAPGADEQVQNNTIPEAPLSHQIQSAPFRDFLIVESR
jgi:hypothetical protein